MKTSHSYGQRHELEFIRNLGGYSAYGGRKRLALLQGYLASLGTRAKWFDDARVGALRRAAEEMIEVAMQPCKQQRRGVAGKVTNG